MKITDTIIQVGVNDRNVTLFEGQFVLEKGMAYNSYAVVGEKIAIMDSVEKSFGEEWINNINNALKGKTPDYLVVQHMEPDHSANILTFANTYPNAKIVSSAKAFVMMEQFFGDGFADRQIVVGEGDTLDLGGRTLTFLTAPMVHWPEVIVSYDSLDKVLFSADGFGKFGTTDADEDWACEARRYYFGIVGKYGMQVSALLKKASNLEIKKICPLHGPVLSENLDYYLNLYSIWASYGVESEGIVIAYTSVYGNTEKAVKLLADRLKANGCEKVVVNNLIDCDRAEAVEDAFRYGTLVLATTTYNGDIFPNMKEFIDALTERGYKNRKIALIENGSWAPMAVKVMTSMFEKSKGITFAENNVKILSAVNEETKEQIKKLADELCN